MTSLWTQVLKSAAWSCISSFFQWVLNSGIMPFRSAMIWGALTPVYGDRKGSGGC